MRHFLSLKKSIQAEWDDLNRLDDKNSDRVLHLRSEFLSCCIDRPSEWREAAVERIMEFGRSDRGEKIRDCPAMRDTLALLADMRLSQTYTTGGAQVWKSLSHLLLFVELLANARINLGWFFATRTSARKQAVSQIRAVGQHYLQSMPRSPKVLRANTEIFEVEGAIGNISYASTTSSSGDDVAIGAEAASFQAAILFEDEKSQHPEGSDFSARLGAGQVESRPIRSTGTPGGGKGIEVYMEKCEHLFTPSCYCENCGALIWLEPLDVLILNAGTDEEPKYFGSQGEILRWRLDENGQPFAGCPSCSFSVEPNSILNSNLRDRRCPDHPTAQIFLDSLDNAPYYPWVGIYLSPLLRVIHNKGAIAALYQKGITTLNLSDFHQQHLGYSSQSFRQNGITIASLQAAAQVEIPRHDSSFIVAGIDQGTEEWFVWIEKVYGYDSWDAQGWETSAVREVLFADAINAAQALSILDRYETDFCLIDNEPDRSKAYDLSLQSDGLVALADQRIQLDAFKRGVVQTGGRRIPCYLFNQALYQDLLANGFSPKNSRYRLSEAIATKRLCKHLCAPKRDGNGVWRRPKDHDDDLFFAALFARAASGIFVAGGG